MGLPLQIIRQDITKIQCDAVVNPTDRFLSGGGGVDAAIHSAAGKQMDKRCREIGSLSLGEAIVTSAYGMDNCEHVIHVVGPHWQGGFEGEIAILRSCYREALRLALENHFESVAFPLIASGSLGCPKDKVLKIALEIIGEFLENNEMQIYLLVYDKSAYELSKSLRDDVESYIDSFYVDESRYFRASAMVKQRRITENKEASRRLDDVLESRSIAPSRIEREYTCCDCSLSEQDLLSMLREMDKSFSDTLLDYIDKKGITDVEAYKRSNVSRKVFSKIRCEGQYKPSKVTAVSFAIGLRLNLDETEHLLSTAGMCLSRSSKFDVIIEYFIRTGNYNNIHDVNEVLYQYDQVLLGC